MDLGGIFVEVLKDVTFRVAPVTASQAKQMITEIRGAPILAGVRGEAPRDRAQLAETVCRYSRMILDLAVKSVNLTRTLSLSMKKARA